MWKYPRMTEAIIGSTMLQIGRRYRCPVRWDKDGVIWIKKLGKWYAIDYQPTKPGLRGRTKESAPGVKRGATYRK